jgi:hypothetical protein
MADFSLDNVPHADRLALADKVAGYVAAKLAAHFPDTSGYSRKVVQPPSWVGNRPFAVEIRIRRGWLEGYDLRLWVEDQRAREFRFRVPLITLGAVLGVLGFFFGVGPLFPDLVGTKPGVYCGLICGVIAGGLLVGGPLLFVLNRLRGAEGRANSTQRIAEINAIVDQAFHQAWDELQQSGSVS